MPASMPCTTEGEIAWNHVPSSSRPRRICTRPAPATSTPSAAIPCFATASATSTVSPAAGPLTCRLLPGNAPATRPPTMPVTMPSSAGTPDATATPTHSGRATRKTTSEARRSGIRALAIRRVIRERPSQLAERRLVAVGPLRNDAGPDVVEPAVQGQLVPIHPSAHQGNLGQGGELGEQVTPADITRLNGGLRSGRCRQPAPHRRQPGRVVCPGQGRDRAALAVAAQDDVGDVQAVDRELDGR